MIKRVIHESPTGSFIAYRETAEERERRQREAASELARADDSARKQLSEIRGILDDWTLSDTDFRVIVGEILAPQTPTAPPTEAEGAEAR